jgi:hypothetical protein
MESLLSLSPMHRDHELISVGRERLRRALIVSSKDAHGRSGLDGVSPYPWRFMESSVFLSDLLTAHEPEFRKPLEINKTIFRFMGSPHPFSRTHWDHEPDLRKLLEINKTVFRFMESFDLQNWTRIEARNRALQHFVA